MNLRKVSEIRDSKLNGGAITILKNISQWEGLSHILWILTSKIILKNHLKNQLIYPIFMLVKHIMAYYG